MKQAKTFSFEKSKYLPHQWEFLQSTSNRLCLSTGYGGGKTFVFLRKVFKCHIEKVNPSTGKSTGWIIYPTYSLAEQLFIPDFLSLLEKLNIKYDYNISKQRIVTSYGEIRMFSLQNPNRIVGGNVTFVGIDEMDVENPTKVLSTYHKAISRLRGCENAPFFTVSTVEGYKALYSIFYEQPSAEKHIIRAKSTDNPFLPAGYIDSLRNDYDSLMQLQYIDGIPQNLNGSQAYYSFHRSQVIPCSHMDTADGHGYTHQLWIGMDFNVNPMTAVCRIVIDGISYAIKQYRLFNSNTRRLCQAIREDYPDRPIIICPDMTGEHHSTNAHLTDIEILKEYGFQVQGKRNMLQKDRLNLVNNAHEKGKVMYDPSCTDLIKDRERVILIDNHIDKSEEGAPNYRAHQSDADDYGICQIFHHQPHWGTI